MKAQGFADAAAYLTDGEMPIEQRMMAAIPIITLAALACELYLKCLVVLETGKLEWGHNLKHLFDRLDNETKRRLRAGWDADVAPRHKQVGDALEKMGGKPIPRDLPTALHDARQAFEKLRYSYEADVSQVSFMLSDVPWLLRREILSRRPEWRNLRPRVEEGSRPAQEAR